MVKNRTPDALRLEVSRLRAEGKSFGQIGENLGISKQYAHRLFQQGPPSPTSTPSTGDASSSVTIRRMKFAAGLAAGKSQRQAALDAGSNSLTAADDYAQRTLKNPEFQSDFGKLLARKGITEDAVAEIHHKLLHAKRVIHATHEGKITDTLEVDDNTTQMRATETAWDILGRRQLIGPQVSIQSEQLAILIGLPRSKPLIVDRLSAPLSAPAQSTTAVSDSDTAGPGPAAVQTPTSEELAPTTADSKAPDPSGYLDGDWPEPCETGVPVTARSDTVRQK